MKTYLNAGSLSTQASLKNGTRFVEEWNDWIAEKQEEGGLSQKYVFFFTWKIKCAFALRLSIIRTLRRSDPELEHLFHSAVDNESGRQ